MHVLLLSLFSLKFKALYGELVMALPALVLSTCAATHLSRPHRSLSMSDGGDRAPDDGGMARIVSRRKRRHSNHRQPRLPAPPVAKRSPRGEDRYEASDEHSQAAGAQERSPQASRARVESLALREVRLLLVHLQDDELPLVSVALRGEVERRDLELLRQCQGPAG